MKATKEIQTHKNEFKSGRSKIDPFINVRVSTCNNMAQRLRLADSSTLDLYLKCSLNYLQGYAMMVQQIPYQSFIIASLTTDHKLQIP